LFFVGKMGERGRRSGGGKGPEQASDRAGKLKTRKDVTEIDFNGRGPFKRRKKKRITGRKESTGEEGDLVWGDQVGRRKRGESRVWDLAINAALGGEVS